MGILKNILLSVISLIISSFNFIERDVLLSFPERRLVFFVIFTVFQGIAFAVSRHSSKSKTFGKCASLVLDLEAVLVMGFGFRPLSSPFFPPQFQTRFFYLSYMICTCVILIIFRGSPFTYVKPTQQLLRA